MLTEAHEFLQNLIDIPAWDKARWSGTGFIIHPNHPHSPFLVLAFEDETAAKDIFAGFRERIGRSDEENLIRICIVEGTIKGNPHAYVVHISPNADNIFTHFNVEIEPNETLPFALISRMNDMNPNGRSDALYAFKDVASKGKNYTLIPATVKNGQMAAAFPELGITKSEIFFRRAEDIGKDDLDAALRDYF